MPPALHDVLSAAARRLREAGIAGDAAAADVDVLARHVLGWDRARLLARRLDPVPAGFVDRFQPLIERRATRAPVAYLTGTREFYGLLFEVTPAVLVPRPETELAVEAALACLADRGDPPRVVDVGTGSGCIAVALATARGDAALVATDRSRAALAVARRNAGRHHVEDRVRLLAADALDAFAPDAFDLVVSNPPYVPDDSPEVWADVRDHEPASALYAGADGLDVVRRLIAAAPGRLRAGGHLVIEIGAGQAPAVAELAAAAGTWTTPVDFRLDLQGIARVAVLSLPSAPSR